MTKLKAILVALALSLSLLTGFNPVPAEAAVPVVQQVVAGTDLTPRVQDPGGGGSGVCSSRKQNRVDSWGVTVPYQLVSRFPRFQDVRVSDSVIYRFCPRGRYEDLIQPIKVSHCWTLLNERDAWFQGTFNQNHFSDNNEDIDLISWRVRDDGTRQNCSTQTIALWQRKWLEMGEDPGWEAGPPNGRVVLWHRPDVHYHMEYVHNPIKYFHPRLDTPVSNWYN